MTVGTKGLWLGAILGMLGLSLTIAVLASVYPVTRYFPLSRPETTAAPETTMVPTKPPALPKSKGFNILLIGTDTWSNLGSRADLIMVVHIDRGRKRINVISVPRDTRVELPGVGFTKLNHAHIWGEKQGGDPGGTGAVAETVSQLLKCPIEHYIKVNFRGFEDLIESVGGLEIEMDQPVRLTFDQTVLPRGRQHLGGHQALELVRERFSLSDGDFGRQHNQFQVLKALCRKLLTPPYLSKLLPMIGQAKQKVVRTNLSDLELLNLAWQVRQIGEAGIRYCQIPGKAGAGKDPLTRTTLYYWIPDPGKTAEIGREMLRTP